MVYVSGLWLWFVVLMCGFKFQVAVVFMAIIRGLWLVSALVFESMYMYGIVSLCAFAYVFGLVSVLELVHMLGLVSVLVFVCVLGLVVLTFVYMFGSVLVFELVYLLGFSVGA